MLFRSVSGAAPQVTKAQLTLRKFMMQAAEIKAAVIVAHFDQEVYTQPTNSTPKDLKCADLTLWTSVRGRIDKEPKEVGDPWVYRTSGVFGHVSFTCGSKALYGKGLKDPPMNFIATLEPVTGPLPSFMKSFGAANIPFPRETNQISFVFIVS